MIRKEEKVCQSELIISFVLPALQNMDQLDRNVAAT
jgi:hypothetical protein